mgnify:CR=1 FL=1
MNERRAVARRRQGYEPEVEIREQHLIIDGAVFECDVAAKLVHKRGLACLRSLKPHREGHD